MRLFFGFLFYFLFNSSFHLDSFSSVSCLSSSDCSSDYICLQRDSSSSGYCLKKCTRNSDCYDGVSFCGPAGLCYQGCSVGGDCSSGFECLALSSAVTVNTVKYYGYCSYPESIKVNNNTSATLCNVNSECRFGFVCLGGDAQQVSDTTQITRPGNGYYGYCTATVPVREICYFYAIITGKLGKAIVALVIISIGFGFVTGKIEMKQFITLFTGIILLFGSFQIVNLLTNQNNMLCDIVNLSSPLGVP